MKRVGIVLLMGLFIGGCSTVNDWADGVSDFFSSDDDVVGEAEK